MSKVTQARKPGFDQRLWLRFWRIAKPFWFHEQKWLARGLLALLVRSLTGPSKSWVVAYSGSCSRVARDQHQPASSRAIAVVATVCFFLRWL